MANRIYPVVEVAQVPSSSLARFRHWVRVFGGPTRLGRALTTDRRVVHTWVQPVRPVTPAPTTIRNIIALSIDEPLSDGPLTYEDILGPVKILRKTKHTFGQLRSPRPVMTRRVI